MREILQRSAKGAFMNKYMLLAACIISQGLSAQVMVDVKVDGFTQTIVLAEEQEALCNFDGLRVAVCNKKEDSEAVSLEVAVDKDGVIAADQVIVNYSEPVSVCGLEISVIKN